MYLVDTDVVADYLNGRPAAIQLFRSLSTLQVMISLVTFGEIYDGIYAGKRRDAHEAGFLDLLHWVDVLPLDEEIMHLFARIRGNLRDIGQRIGDFDILIAATALHHDLTLVTRNLQHFERIPDLKLYPNVP